VLLGVCSSYVRIVVVFSRLVPFDSILKDYFFLGLTNVSIVLSSN